MINKTDKMATAFIIQLPLYSWHLFKRQTGEEWILFFCAALSKFTSNKWRDKWWGSLFLRAAWEALKLADNKVILVTLFVIPSAISVHLHTFLLPFARRFICIPVSIAQLTTIQEPEFAWNKGLFYTQVGVGVVIFHKVQNGIILARAPRSGNRASSLFTFFQCSIKISFFPIGSKYFSSRLCYHLVQAKDCKRREKLLNSCALFCALFAVNSNSHYFAP